MHSTCPAKHLDVKCVSKKFVHGLIALGFCARRHWTFGDEFKADFAKLHPNYPGEQIKVNQIFQKITYFLVVLGNSAEGFRAVFFQDCILLVQNHVLIKEIFFF